MTPSPTTIAPEHGSAGAAHDAGSPAGPAHGPGRLRPLATRHRLLLVALLLVLLIHTTLLVAGSFEGSYDAYVHVFFADHYRRDWFSSWDARWYTGFSVFAYPPAAHQAVAALSFLVGLLPAYVVVQTAALLLLVVGVYRFARLWVSERAAGWAAILAVVSGSVAETVHVFGQLPTIAALAFVLNALPFLDDWIRRRSRFGLLAALGCVAAAVACHHLTALFGGVFFIAPALLAAVLAERRRTRDAVVPAVVAAAVFGVLALVVLAVVVLPYWLYALSNPIDQVSIPHGSRDSYLLDPDAGTFFWLIPWGMLVVALPYAFIRGFRGPAWPLAASIALLTLIGTGGTTVLPRILLGPAYDILTLDRFTFWATVAVLPFAGALLASSLDGRVNRWLRLRLGSVGAGVLIGLVALLQVATMLLAANLTQFRTLQPDSVDVTQMADFMAKDQHDNWRYLALGLGDQIAWLSANTTAQTVDGDYHSARDLPELTSRPIERLEGAKYSGAAGLAALRELLGTPGTYNLKYVFNNDDFYAPLLDASGFTDIGVLENGVVVWERADVAPLPVETQSREGPVVLRVLWGVLPPLAVLTALVLLAWALGTGRGGGPLSGGLRIDGDDDAPVTPPTPAVTPVAFVLAGALVLVGVGTGAAAAFWPRPGDPADVVSRYYEALDDRELADAYALLDPATRPSEAQFERDIGVDGGLVASAAILTTVQDARASVSGDRAVVTSTREYLTSVDSRYRVAGSDELVERDGRWRIVATPALGNDAADEFTDRAGLDFVQQGRRGIDVTASSPEDVLDRPEITVGDVRTLRSATGWSVIGTVTNTDTVPADVTVSADVSGAGGTGGAGVLASRDASDVVVHKLYPGGSTPFRIDVGETPGIGVAEADLVQLVTVRARGVVTATAPAPSLQLMGLTAARADDGSTVVRGTLRNDGTTLLSVPRLLVSYRDDDGALVWADTRYLPSSILPQSATPFEFTVPDAGSLPPEVTPADGVTTLTSAGASHAGPDDPAATLLPLPEGTGFASVAVLAAGYTRGDAR